jgi:predicted DNA-binding protein (MmcQ/YjbR family)
MTRGELRGYLLGKPEAHEDFPFGPDVAVMKVRGKMFATLVNAIPTKP